MTDMNKINVAALENVAGGYETHTVHNDAVSYANCRKEPGLNSKVFFTIPNGTQVYTTEEGRLCMVRDHAGWRL